MSAGKSGQAMFHFIRRKAAARVREKTGQAIMKPGGLHVVALGHLVEEPQGPMHGDLLDSGQFAQNSVAR